MAKKIGIRLIGSVLAGAILLVAPAVTWSAEGKMDGTEMAIQRMESHWQTLVRERDPVKRKVLISEHRRMMDESRMNQGANQSPPIVSRVQGGMMTGHHQHDLRNTADMHTMMLDMMQ